MNTICLIPGDGIGREVIPAARAVLDATGFTARYVEAEAGWETFQQRGTALPDATLELVRQANATLFGAVSSPSERVEGYRSPIVAMRKALDLYACVRPVQSLPLPDARPGVDIVVVRENTEGLYSVIETREGNCATALRVVTREASRRIARFALDLARREGRRRVTVVHKANVLRETCGLFRETALEVLRDREGIEVNEMLVDNCAYQLARRPEQFDVIVTTNLFGDILSDIASAWGGGLGLAASANLGNTTGVFEPVHGSAPDIAGQGVANPLAAIAAAASMLDFLGETERSRNIRSAIRHVIEHGPLTPDLGGTATTEALTNAVVTALTN
jgi:homoisocitrate dehydrogenase